MVPIKRTKQHMRKSANARSGVISLNSEGYINCMRSTIANTATPPVEKTARDKCRDEGWEKRMNREVINCIETSSIENVPDRKELNGNVPTNVQ